MSRSDIQHSSSSTASWEQGNYVCLAVSFCLCVSTPHSPLSSFRCCYFVCFPYYSSSSQKRPVPLGFLSFLIAPPFRKASLSLMSSASVALSLRLSTADLLAFASLCLILSYSSVLFFSPCKALFFPLRLKIKWWRRYCCIQSSKASPSGHFNSELLLTSHLGSSTIAIGEFNLTHRNFLPTERPLPESISALSWLFSELTSSFHIIHQHFHCKLKPILTLFRLYFQPTEKWEAVQAGTASLTTRHLIFRLHSIKLGGSGQLMSTMTFSSRSATAAFNHGWLGDETQSPAKLEVVYCCMTGCYNCSFHWSSLQSSANYRDTQYL